jgi:hypothetical protein
MAKYLFLLWHDEAGLATPGTPAMDEQLAAYGAYYEDAAGKGVFQSGDPLTPSSAAKTVRVRDGRTDAATGPHGKGPDQLIGFYVLDVADEGEAVEWAARIPAASTGAIEVRPVLSM